MFKQIVVSAAVMVATTMPALANNCASRDQVVAKLQGRFSEQLTAGGLQATQPVDTMIEVWSSPETGTFTILLTTPDGTSCIVAAGTDFFSGPVTLKPTAQQS